MIKETGDSMKESVNNMAGKMKQTVQTTSSFAMESAEELVDILSEEDKIKNRGMKKQNRKPSAPVPKNYHQINNVLSDEEIRQRLTNLDQ